MPEKIRAQNLQMSYAKYASIVTILSQIEDAGKCQLQAPNRPAIASTGMLMLGVLPYSAACSDEDFWFAWRSNNALRK
jgi:hypothetical protein